jgi:hypothetical protein
MAYILPQSTFADLTRGLPGPQIIPGAGGFAAAQRSRDEQDAELRASQLRLDTELESDRWKHEQSLRELAPGSAKSAKPKFSDRLFALANTGALANIANAVAGFPTEGGKSLMNAYQKSIEQRPSMTDVGIKALQDASEIAANVNNLGAAVPLAFQADLINSNKDLWTAPRLSYFRPG